MIIKRPDFPPQRCQKFINKKENRKQFKTMIRIDLNSIDNVHKRK